MFSLSSIFYNCCRLRNGSVLLAPASAGMKNSVQKKLGLPPKPKRPPSSYCLFVRKIYPDLRTKYPENSAVQNFKIAAEMWQNVDTKLLKELEEDAQRERMKYSDAVQNYNSKLTLEQSLSLKEAHNAEKLQKEKKELNQKLTALGMPKRPTNAFLLFRSDWMKKNPEGPSIEATNVCAKLWKELPEGEKRKWRDTYSTLMADYEQKLRVWEANMIKQGKLEITYDSVLKERVRVGRSKSNNPSAPKRE